MRPEWKILATVALTCALAQTAVADRMRVELSDPAIPAQLSVEIEWGSIRIVGDAAAGGLSIEAVPDRPGEIAGSLITVGEDGNLVTVRQAPLPSGTFRSTNLEITTPPETSLSLRMNRGGDIRVRGIRGQVEVTNLNGSVELDGVAGAAAVNASNGSIRAGFAEVDPERDMIFTSLNGSVELCLPSSYSGRLHLSTAGDSIRSDFAVEREEIVRTVAPGETAPGDRSEVRGRIGSNEAQLRVSTLNGEIHLARCQ